MKHNGKTIALINVYRIPATSSNGATCSLTQYNLQEGKSRSTKHYRTDILKQIKTYVMNNHEITNIIIAGDFNQNIGLDEIQRFYQEIGVKDTHSWFNNIQLDQMDRTHIRGSHPIDSIALSSGLMEAVEGVEGLDHGRDARVRGEEIEDVLAREDDDTGRSRGGD